MNKPQAGVPHKHAEVIKACVQKFAYDDGRLFWNDNYAPRARKGFPAGSVDTHGYRQIGVNGALLFEHQIIFYMFHGYVPEQVDHRDRNRLNNKIENLRASNNTKNQHNASTRKDNTTGQTGVTFRRGKYTTRISCMGVRITLGTFKTFEEAQTEYLKAKEKYHGTA